MVKRAGSELAPTPKRIADLPSDMSDSSEGLEESDFGAEGTGSVASSADSAGTDYESDGQENQDDSEPEHNPDKPSKTGLGRKVGAQDVREARDAAELFKSNVFKLQVDGVLDEIRVEDKHIQQATKTLFGLKNSIQSASAIGPLPLKEARSAVQCRIPFPDPAPSAATTNYKFAFSTPADVNIVGSFALHTATRRPEGCGIDVLVVMPPELFEAKDYVNYRYFHKRAFYLAALADIVAANAGTLGLGEARFVLTADDPLRPVLRIDFASRSLAKRFHIILHIGIPTTMFIPRKLGTDRNSVRQNQTAPTPRYNASVLKDMAPEILLNYLHRAQQTCPAFGDAVKLTALWLRQRGLGSRPGAGGVGAFELSVLMAALLNGGTTSGKRVLLAGHSSYQLFKGLMVYIANQSPLELEFAPGMPSVPTSKGRLVLESLGLDILAHAPEWGLALLRLEAQRAVELLNDSRDRFAALFLKHVNSPRLRFDYHCTVTCPDALHDSYSAAQWPRFHDWVASQISAVLGEAWRSRARLVVVQAPPSTSWSLSSAPPATAELQGSYQVGAWLDADNAEKRVTFAPETGPSSDSGLFRQFWGPRASLRRFQDGAIKEAVVWTPGVRPIVEEIAQYALERHLSASVEGAPLIERYSRTSHGVQAFRDHIDAFRALAQVLIELRDLPLRVASVHGTSASLRYASLAEPVAWDASTAMGAGALEFESSAKWPAEPQACEYTKSAILVRVAELLRKHAPNYAAVMGVETLHLSSGPLEGGVLTIQTPSGHYFKIRVLGREPSSVLRAKADHTRLVATLAQRFPTASGAIRALKAWFQRHLLLGHVPEPAVELLALRPFVDPAPFDVPTTVSTAVWRALDFLAGWDWREEPLVLLDNETATSGMLAKLGELFSRQRRQDPALTQAPWVIFSRADASGIVWTAQEPRSRIGILIATRVTTLARAALQAPSIRAAWTPSLTDYDVEFQVDNSDAGHALPKNVALSDPHRAVVHGTFNSGREFFDTIRRAYSDCLILFYTGYPDSRESDQIITGIWIRSAVEPHVFKAGLAYPTRQIESSESSSSAGKYTVDKAAVLAEIERLGRGFVTLIRGDQ